MQSILKSGLIFIDYIHVYMSKNSVQKMSVLSINDYCSGESGAQPASPSLKTKETKVGPL